MFSKLLLPPSPSPFNLQQHHSHPSHLLTTASSQTPTHLTLCTTLANVAPSRWESDFVKSTPVTLDVEDFPASLRRELMPRHVALILNGNRRWAKLRGLQCEVGHDQMISPLLDVMGLCVKWGIQVATFFMFSTENWSRSKQEVDFLMWRFEKMLVDEVENFKRQGIRITTIGDMSKLPKSLQEVIKHTIQATQDNNKTHAILAISYSGKNDVTQAFQSIATKVRNGLVEAKDITESVIERELQTKITKVPCPDLLIRTSGEVRISNFLLWQLAYAELYFTNTLWPDFGEPEFVEALQSFQRRERRFGGQ